MATNSDNSLGNQGNYRRILSGIYAEELKAHFSVKGQSLYLYINPDKLDFSYKERINRTRTRAGWVDEYWGEDLTTISADAVTGGFYTVSDGYYYNVFHDLNGQGPGAGGSKTSLALVVYNKLADLFTNNGYTFNNKPNKGSKIRAWGEVDGFSPISFHFDSKTYNGYFDSFNTTHNESTPYMFNFSFTFKVLSE